MKKTIIFLFVLLQSIVGFSQKIDRFRLVARNNVVLNKYNSQAALQVGNGQFAFSVDITGLQSFDEQLGTFSEWGWHSFQKPQNVDYKNVLTEVEFYGRKTNYEDPSIIKMPHITKTEQISLYKRQSIDSLSEEKRTTYWYYRFNPHRLHLGCIGMDIKLSNGELARLDDLSDVKQELNLWEGTITSFFSIEGIPVLVTTLCHPKQDVLAVKIISPLIKKERLKIFWNFPYMKENPEKGPDFLLTEAHESKLFNSEKQRVNIERNLDGFKYFVSIKWNNGSAFQQTEKHKFYLTPDNNTDEISIITSYTQKPVTILPSYKDTNKENVVSWKKFWTTGGAVDFAACQDPRAKELERRVILSQYLTAIQCSGDSPPQETGLYNNLRWYGKFHLEMLAWHGTHFALWGRDQLLEHWLEWLRTTGFKGAKERAERQGYKGIRWNKMIDKNARWESPSGVGPYRITQQGHVIFLAELLYKKNKSEITLKKYSDMVFSTADFMADFVNYDCKNDRYVIGPPVISGSEFTFGHDSQNPTVELSYWAFGLETAQKWRERLGMEREPTWDKVLAKLAYPPINDSVYIDMESHPNAWEGRPAWLEAYGCMNGTRINPRIMLNTYNRIVADYAHWDKKIWGCDFPMFAMTATRLGKPEEALNWLLFSTFRNNYLANGANVGGGGAIPYLPANGGLLWAVGLMCAGWEGCTIENPGFPKDGTWNVKWEGLSRMF